MAPHEPGPWKQSVEPELVGLGRVRGWGQLSLGRGRERGAGGAQGWATQLSSASGSEAPLSSPSGRQGPLSS